MTVWLIILSANITCSSVFASMWVMMGIQLFDGKLPEQHWTVVHSHADRRVPEHYTSQISHSTLLLDRCVSNAVFALVATSELKDQLCPTRCPECTIPCTVDGHMYSTLLCTSSVWQHMIPSPYNLNSVHTHALTQICCKCRNRNN